MAARATVLKIAPQTKTLNKGDRCCGRALKGPTSGSAKKAPTALLCSLSMEPLDGRPCCPVLNGRTCGSAKEAHLHTLNTSCKV